MDSKIPDLNPAFFPNYRELVIKSADFFKIPEILEVKEEEKEL